MHAILEDRFDHVLLKALQEDSTQTNAQLAERVHLSPTQCSRRRARLEQAGVIAGYGARLNAMALGFGLHAVTRVNLSSHSARNAEAFHSFLETSPEVRNAFSVSGDSDYVLLVLCRDLEAFADFIHARLLPHPLVSQVRSEIVLQVVKDAPGVPL